MALTTDLGHNPWRPLLKNFAGPKAMTSDNPNTLNSNLPSVTNAMGVVPESGIVSYTFEDSAVTSSDITAYIWNPVLNKINTAQGWDLGAESTSLHTKTVARRSVCSIKLPAGAAYFLQAQAGSVPTNLIVGDKGPHDMNQNTDRTLMP